jgi:glycosyltransferase involved in cell wall biosynthesis
MPNPPAMRRKTRTGPGENVAPPEIFFTIVAWNYISYAATLMESVARAHPRSRRCVIVCDHPRSASPVAVDAELLYLHQLGIDDVQGMAFAYGVMEFATAIKPYLFLHFLREDPAGHVVYVDPDIQFMARLAHVFAALHAGAGLVLTPHIMRPLQDGRQPDDLTIMKSGIYNLGFLAARAESETLIFLRWWADRCRRDAVVDIPNHKFTDQRWVDLAPAFVGAVHILRHPGYNIAYWNLTERHIARDGSAYTVNGTTIHFLHFSGVAPGNREILSKHQDRFQLTDLPAYAELHGAYLAAVLAHGWRETAAIPYGFNAFTNGRAIHHTMRASFRRHEQSPGERGAAPASADGAQAFASGGEIFDREEPSLARHGPPGITRAMYELWSVRNDLRQSFAIEDAAQRAAYLNWFIEHGWQQAGFDELSRAGAERLRAAAAGSAPPPHPGAIRRKLPEPWPPQAPLIHHGPREKLGQWLAAAVPLKIVTTGAGVYVPRMLALLWEARADLRSHFPLQDTADLEAYITWCITRGVLEGHVPLDLIASRLGRYLDGNEDASADRIPQPLPPRTRLLRLVAGEYHGAFRDVVEKSPHDERAAFALVLWLCGTMRQQYRWPAAMLARPLAWLAEPAMPDRVAMNGGGTADGTAAPPGLRIGLAPLIPNAVHACYRLRRDVQDAFDISTGEGRWRLLAWYVAFGRREFSLTPDLTGPKFLAWLARPADLAAPWAAGAAAGAADGGIRHIDYLVWLARPDVRDSFSLETEAGARALGRWMAHEGARDPGIGPWLAAMAPPPSATTAIRCDVCLTGLWGVASGRGEDIRLTAAALRHQGVDFVIFDRRGERFLDFEGSEAAVDPAAVRVNIVHLNADTALWDYLALHRAGLTGAYTIGYWAWELERLPAAWNFAHSMYDEVWAATRFAQQAFQHSFPRDVRLMPMAVDLPEEPSVLTRADFGLPQDAFVFYYGFDFRSYMARKNPQAAVAAFLAAFGGTTQNVRLVLKTLAAAEAGDDERALRAQAAADPRIMFIDREYTRPDLFALIGSCDCFVSPHRSEGFGRGIAEAMLMGVPVIVTGYSGNMDFTTEETARLVGYRMVPVGEGEYPGGDGQMWADVDVVELAAAMQDVANHRRARSEVAKAGRRVMQQDFSIEAVGEVYRDRIAKIMSIRDNAASDSAELPKDQVSNNDQGLPVT